MHHQTVEALDCLQHASEPGPDALETPVIHELRSVAAQAFANLKDSVQPEDAAVVKVNASGYASDTTWAAQDGRSCHTARVCPPPLAIAHVCPSLTAGCLGRKGEHLIKLCAE